MLRSNKRITLGSTETGATQFVETGNYGLAGSGSGMGGGGLPSGTGTTAIASPQIDLPVLDGFMNLDRRSKNRMFREMFEYDPTSGAAVDMLSTLPFSDFSLIGMNDEKRLSKYVQSVERMRIKTQLPVMATDYFVFGAHISVMNWDEQYKIYDALLPQNIDFLDIQSVPVAGSDPLIKLTFPPEVQQLLKNKDARVKEILDRVPETLQKALNSKAGFDLNPDDLLFIGRSGTSGDFAGFAAFNRLLPVWLIEKALYRGTLDQSWKRQRGILHISMGDPEWTPIEAEYQQVGQWFSNADHDPTGAIVVTRDGVNVNEIRRGDDFWKVNDISDWATKQKLMALGISEGFLAGDGNVTAMENSLSVIIQYFTQFRDLMTREVFYDKNFPTIARENGFFRRQNIAVSSYERYDMGVLGLGPDGSRGRLETANGFIREPDGTFTAEFGAKASNEGSYYDRTKYEMPKVHWHNSMKADSTRDYVDLLSTLEEKGVPIPMRMWAAASGMTIRELVEQQQSDQRIREQFLPWIKDIRKYRKASDLAAEEGDGEGGGGFEGASAKRPYSPSIGKETPRWFEREFGDTLGPVGLNHRGKMVPVSAQRAKEINEKANVEAATAAAHLHSKNNHKQQELEKANRQRSYSYNLLRSGRDKE